MKSDTKIANLLTQLSIEEKAMLSSGKDFWHLPGVERLDLPSIMVTDGPHGLRKQPADADHMGLSDSVPATCFPTASGLAASWNRKLLRDVGVALGEECRTENVSVLLGPGVNIKRNPLGGRNFEYFSEDPLLSGVMASEWIQGVQSQEVGTSLKHYAVNNHEEGRTIVDAIVDERTLREIYLAAFELAVKSSQPWTIMCSYNKLNGTYLAEHKGLLTDILQKEWQYEGLVVTDWGAVHDRVLAIKNGLHLEMPSSGEVNTQKIIAAIGDGSLSMEELDNSVAGVLRLIVKSKSPLGHHPDFSFDEHHQLARKAAEEACVLLKNDHQQLPLNEQQRIVVLGSLATQTRYQGSGSSQINPTHLEQPLDQIRKLIGDKAKVEYSPGYALTGDAVKSQIEEALTLARDCDQVILFAGLTPEFESEGFDRSHLQLPQAQLDLISALTPFHEKITLVLQNGAPIDLTFSRNIPAIIEAYLGGQAGASAVADILFGHVNPSGKLAESFPLSLDDVPSQPYFPGRLRQSEYRESIWVGYRYFDTADIPVEYPFGHGLSYTTFEYSGLSISGTTEAEQSNSFHMQDATQLSVEFTVKNVGARAGAEIAQLYVGQQNSSVFRAKKELRGFSKVYLKPGEEIRVSLTLDARAFSFWHTKDEKWVVENDDYSIFVGASSADVRLQDSIKLLTENKIAERDAKLGPYFEPQKKRFDDAAFTALLGREIPEIVPTRPFQMNSTLNEIQETWVGRQLNKVVKKSVLKMVGNELSETDRIVMEAIVSDMPLRNIVNSSEGKISITLMTRLIHMMNKDWFKLITGDAALSR